VCHDGKYRNGKGVGVVKTGQIMNMELS